MDEDSSQERVKEVVKVLLTRKHQTKYKNIFSFQTLEGNLKQNNNQNIW